MLEMKRELERRLTEKRVQIEVPDANTVLFRGVPTNESFFNKPKTNLLVKRARPGSPFLVCVDADLLYEGNNGTVNRVFGVGAVREGWRPLFLTAMYASSQVPTNHLDAVLEDALAALGFGGEEPAALGACASASDEKALLETLGEDLSACVQAGKAPPTVAREDETHETAACMLRWSAVRMPVVLGPSGVGKSNLLYAVAGKLIERRPPLRLIRIDLARLLNGTLFESERESLVSGCLQEAVSTPDAALALEHFEQVLCVPRGVLHVAEALDAGARIVATLLPRHGAYLNVAPLARRLQLIRLREPDAHGTAAVLAALREKIADHHGIQVPESCLPTCVKAARPLAGHFPAKAITLLDAAASRAALAGTKLVGPDDVYFAAERHHGAERPEEEASSE